MSRRNLKELRGERNDRERLFKNEMNIWWLNHGSRANRLTGPQILLNPSKIDFRCRDPVCFL